MREYIERQIELVGDELEDAFSKYKASVLYVHNSAEKYASEDAVADMKSHEWVQPDNSQTNWVETACVRVRENAVRVRDLQKELVTLKQIKSELDKYESPGTVTVDDAARKIVSNMKQARLHAKGLTLKKDQADRRYYHGLEDAYQKALLEMGYTNEQIEEMMK